MLPWRWLAVVGEGPALLMIVLLVFMPRSPRRLLSLGQEEKARTVLRWLRGEHYDTQTELLTIQVVSWGLGLWVSATGNQIELNGNLLPDTCSPGLCCTLIIEAHTP